MKKIPLFAAAMILLFCLAGCGGENGRTPSAVPADNAAAQSPPSGSGEPSGPAAPTAAMQPAGPSENQKAEREPKDNQGNAAMRISVRSDADGYEIIYELNGSQAARGLYEQLPLTTKVEPFSNNEMIFYPPEELDTADAPLSGGQPGSLSYYAPWGDVALLYAPCSPNGGLYEIGTATSGADDISKLNGSVTISACQ